MGHSHCPYQVPRVGTICPLSAGPCQPPSMSACFNPSSQAARRIVAPIGCRTKWRRTRSCTARLHDSASWPGVSCRMLPPESSGNEAGRRPQRHPPATALLPCSSGCTSSAAVLPSSEHRAEGIRPRCEASRRATVSRHACDTMSPRHPDPRYQIAP